MGDRVDVWLVQEDEGVVDTLTECLTEMVPGTVCRAFSDTDALLRADGSPDFILMDAWNYHGWGEDHGHRVVRMVCDRHPSAVVVLVSALWPAARGLYLELEDEDCNLDWCSLDVGSVAAALERNGLACEGKERWQRYSSEMELALHLVDHEA